MKEIKVGSKLKINNLIGIVLKKEGSYALIKFECGQYVYKVLGMSQNNILE